MSTPATPLLLTYRQAAELLQVSDRTVWALVNDGKLRAVRFAGRTVRIDPADLREFINRSKSRPTPALESIPEPGGVK